MRAVRGFALVLSLVLVLILTVFAYWMLLLAEKHYAASRMLFDSENARIMADSSATRLVLQHNVQLPRFFSEPSSWSGLELKPLIWNDYRISGNLAVPWSDTGINLLTLHVQKKRSFAKLELPLKQIRFEDFALYSDSSQQLISSTLFDGLLFVRGGLTIAQPVRFREAVHNDVTPSFYASYRKRNRLWLDFPPMNPPNLSGSLNFSIQAAPFWQSDHYELDLDRLELNRSINSWEVKYEGITIGETETLTLAFDRSVHISQSFRKLSHLPPQTEAPLTIASKEDVVIKGSIQSLRTNQREFPLLIYSEDGIQVSSTLAAVRIDACLLSSSGLNVQPGDTPLTDAEKVSWIDEIYGSTFVVESERKTDLLQTIQNGGKIVWFRGSLGLKGTMLVSPDVAQLHFEACRKIHNSFRSFPFVEVVEGKKKWQ